MIRERYRYSTIVKHAIVDSKLQKSKGEQEKRVCSAIELGSYNDITKLKLKLVLVDQARTGSNIPSLDNNKEPIQCRRVGDHPRRK